MSALILLVVLLVVIGGGWWGWPLAAALFGVKNVNDKTGALQKIAELMRTYDITPAEVSAVLRDPSLIETTPTQRSGSEIARTLFIYLGAIFSLAGIGTHIGMFWNRMGSVMRIVVTLGVGYTLLIVLVSALHEKKFPKLILPLCLATVIMLTSGWFVFIDEVFPHGNNWRLAVLSVFGLMALHQSVLFRKYDLTVLAFTALLFVYGFLQVGLDLLDVPPGFSALILGASLFLVATELEEIDGKFTGRPMGTPCFREGKVTRLEAWLAAHGQSIKSIEKSTFYSDSHNDLPLLEQVTHPVAVDPDAHLRAQATARGWPVMSLG